MFEQTSPPAVASTAMTDIRTWPDEPGWQSSSTGTTSTEPAAAIAFVLALVSVIAWIVPAIVALVLAPRAKRNVRASNGLRSGTGLATAAQVISIVSIVLALAGGASMWISGFR
jgi:hypothetical protein